MWFIPLVRCPRAHQGNKSHNPSLQTDNPYTLYNHANKIVPTDTGTALELMSTDTGTARKWEELRVTTPVASFSRQHTVVLVCDCQWY